MTDIVERRVVYLPRHHRLRPPERKMSDIVERLRNTHPPHHAVEPLLREAAGEIELLRRDIWLLSKGHGVAVRQCLRLWLGAQKIKAAP